MRRSLSGAVIGVKVGVGLVKAVMRVKVFIRERESKERGSNEKKGRVSF